MPFSLVFATPSAFGRGAIRGHVHSPSHGVRVRDVLMSGYTRRVTSGGTERPVGCLAHGPDLAVAMRPPREQDWREPAVQLRSPRSRSAGSFARVTCDEISGSVP